MMKVLNQERSIYALLVISFVVGLILFFIPPSKTLDFWTLLKLVPSVISIDLIIILIFSKYLWKWEIFGWKMFGGWLVLIPNLNGTWKGVIKSTWIDPLTGKNPDPIPAILTVNQSLFNISCIMRTGEMKSSSFIAAFIIDDDNQEKKLTYSYNSNPKQVVIERSPQHQGTVVFDIIEGSEPKLIGQYWTGRKTTGDVELEFWESEKHQTFPTYMGDHPVSKIRS